MKPQDIAPFIRIFLFILGGWLQGQGFNSDVVTYIKTDPQVLSAVILVATGAWYGAAKIMDWKR
jgi:hypothetical protein